MLSHYLELLRLYRARILITVLVAGLTGLMLSVLILKTSPSYTASVTLNMQPSEEALLFNRQFMGQSQFNPATIITQTHIERILSKPVAERAIQKLREERGDVTQIEREPSILGNLKLLLWKTWTRLNYGEYRPAPEELQLTNELLEALDIETVEGSYILKIEAAHEYPTIAADVANAVAETYVVMAAEEFAAESDRAAEVLRQRVIDMDATLDTLLREKETLRQRYDIADIARQASLLLVSIEDAQARLAEDQLKRQLLQIELDRLTDQISGRSSNSTGPINTLNERISDLDQLLSFRSSQIAQKSAELSLLSNRESEFTEINEQIETARAEVATVRQQLSSFELGVQTQARQIQLVSPASAPLYPSSPKVLVNFIASMIVATLLCFMVAVVQDIFGARIRTGADLNATVGDRALPAGSARMLAKKRSFIGLRRFRREAQLRQFIEAFGQTMSVEDGWKSSGIIITGYLPNEELIEVRNFIASVVRQSIRGPGQDEQFKISTIGPIHGVKDWDAIQKGPVIVALKPNQKFDYEIQGALELGRNPVRKPMFMIWRD